jgi:hypothetical protein
MGSEIEPVKRIGGKDKGVLNIPKDQIEQLFFIWYRAGKPIMSKLQQLAEDEGITILPNTIAQIPSKYNWQIRAEALDIEVTRRLESSAIQEKVEMMKRHADAGKRLQDLGLEFLEDSGLSNANVALKAIVQGAQLERASRGIPDALMKVAEMNNEDLSDIVSRLLSKSDVQLKNIPDETDQIINQIRQGDIEDGDFQ